MTEPKDMTKTQRINWGYATDAMRMIEYDLHSVAMKLRCMPKEWDEIWKDDDRRDPKRVRATLRALAPHESAAGSCAPPCRRPRKARRAGSSEVASPRIPRVGFGVAESPRGGTTKKDKEEGQVGTGSAYYLWGEAR